MKKAIPLLHAFDRSGYNVCFSFHVLAYDAECSKLSSVIKCAVIVKYDLSLSVKVKRQFMTQINETLIN